MGDSNGEERRLAPSPRTTIVGGRPPESATQLPPVPTGLERLLRLAGTDRDFERLLVERRTAAAEAAGVALTPNEAAILKAIPAAQLSAMAAGVAAPAPPRRRFLHHAAASAVVALGGAALSACEDPPPMSAGVRPDLPAERASGADDGGPQTPNVPPRATTHDATPRSSDARAAPDAGAAPAGSPDAASASTAPAPRRPDDPDVQVIGGLVATDPPGRPRTHDPRGRAGAASTERGGASGPRPDRGRTKRPRPDRNRPNAGALPSNSDLEK